jgi:hypothetical protein
MTGTAFGAMQRYTIVQCVGNKVVPANSLHLAGKPLVRGEWAVPRMPLASRRVACTS